MSDPIVLGMTEEGESSLDVARLIETRLLIQANSGGGKSWALRRLLEQTHGQIQQIVIDPEGEFVTLRERYDYVLAGEGGDCAADIENAPVLAHQLLKLGVSAIIDIYELRQYQRLDFVEAFIEALVNSPKRLWHPVMVVIDEAHVFCPEQGKAASGAAIIDLATRGRKRGMCAILATQRLSKLRKDAAAELNNVLIGRTGLDVDLRRAGDMLGLSGPASRKALRDLAPGTFYAYGPAMPPGVSILRVGDVETTHPTTGGQLAMAPPPPTERIRGMLASLVELPGIEEATDVETLQAQLAEAKAEVASLKAGVETVESTQDAAAIKAARAEAEAEVAQLRQQLEGAQAREQSLDAENGTLRSRLAEWATLGKRVDHALDTINGATREIDGLIASHEELLDAPAPVAIQPRIGPPPSPRGALPEAQAAILDAMAQLDAMGLRDIKREQIAIFAGVSPKSSSYGKNLARLNEGGYLAYPSSGYAALTHRGHAYARDVQIPPTLADLRERWLTMLPVPQGLILRSLIDRYPKAHARYDLAREIDVSPKSSSFGKNLARLREYGLVIYIVTDDGERQVQAADSLFHVEGVSA